MHDSDVFLEGYESIYCTPKALILFNPKKVRAYIKISGKLTDQDAEELAKSLPGLLVGDELAKDQVLDVINDIRDTELFSREQFEKILSAIVQLLAKHRNIRIFRICAVSDPTYKALGQFKMAEISGRYSQHVECCFLNRREAERYIDRLRFPSAANTAIEGGAVKFG